MQSVQYIALSRRHNNASSQCVVELKLSFCMSVCCSSTVSPSTCVMTSVPTSRLLALIITFSCHGLDDTSKRLRCPLTCRCTGNYSHSIVTCANSYLTDIPQLQVGVWGCLFIGNNITRRLRAGAFSEPCRLRYMRLSKNNIRFIEERAFQGLTSLEMLHLSEQSLSSFEDGLFRFFTNLKLKCMQYPVIHTNYNV